MDDHSVNYYSTLKDKLMAAQVYVREVNAANGWYDTGRSFGDDIALLHSEVSEAYEAWRKNDLVNMAEELADVFIRLLDTCHRYHIDLAGEFYNKMNKNVQRSYRHGGKQV